MRLMFAGDTHGNINHWMRLAEIAEAEAVDEIVQVGDFGYWEHTKEGKAYLDVIADTLPCKLRFIDGNHDNHPLLWSEYKSNGGTSIIRSRPSYSGGGMSTRDTKPVIQYQHRGSVRSYPFHDGSDDGIVMQFMGGAFSIDVGYRQRQNRAGNMCWWPEEMITDAEVLAAKEAACWFDSIDVLVAHDVPSGAPLGRLASLKLSKTLEDEARRNRRQLLEVVRATRPKLLIHGHYHTRLDYFMDYKDLDGNDQRLDCIGLSCDPESHHGYGPMEESYVIVELEDLIR